MLKNDSTVTPLPTWLHRTRFHVSLNYVLWHLIAEHRVKFCVSTGYAPSGHIISPQNTKLPRAQFHGTRCLSGTKYYPCLGGGVTVTIMMMMKRRVVIKCLRCSLHQPITISPVPVHDVIHLAAVHYRWDEWSSSLTVWHHGWWWRWQWRTDVNCA